MTKCQLSCVWFISFMTLTSQAPSAKYLSFQTPLGKFSLHVWIVSTRWEAVCVCVHGREKNKN